MAQHGRMESLKTQPQFQLITKQVPNILPPELMDTNIPGGGTPIEKSYGYVPLTRPTFSH